MIGWAERPVEVRALLNPAFLGMLVNDAARGYESEVRSGLPYILAFVAVPAVLHEPTRAAFPRGVNTSVAAFHRTSPEARVRLAPVAAQLSPFLREAIRFSTSAKVLSFGPGGALVAAKLNRAPRGMNTLEVSVLRDKAFFAGRWFARNGDPATILLSWGLRP